MSRLFLILIWLAQPALARVGERYEDFVSRVGKPEHTYRVERSDFVAEHRHDGRHIYVEVFKGKIGQESYSPVEGKDVPAILDQQELGSWEVRLPPARYSTYYDRVGARDLAFYDPAGKRLFIVWGDFDDHIARTTNRPPGASPTPRPATNAHPPGGSLDSGSGKWRARLLNLLYFGAIFLAMLWPFGWISLLVHEGGHFIAGKLLGMHIREVRLGAGRVVRAFRWGETRWYWHFMPSCGRVDGQPKRGAGTRFQNFCFTAGGPIATALLLALLVWLWTMVPLPPGGIRNEQWLLAAVLKVSWMITAIILFSEVVPVSCPVDGQQVDNDGMLMWKLLYDRKPAPASSEAHRTMQEAFALAGQGRNDEALETAHKAAQACTPEEAQDYRILTAELLMNMGRYAEAAETNREELKNLPSDHPQFAAIVDRFATAALYANARTHYAECEALIRTAITLKPTDDTLKATLAGLVADSGRDVEAKPLLVEAHRRGANELDIGISAAFLSVLAHRKGVPKESAKYRQRAFDFLPDDHPLLKRLFEAPAPSMA